MKPMKLIRWFSILLSEPQMHLCILFGLLCSGTLLGIPAEARAANKFALVIGINEYEHESVTNLQYAVKDAETIRRLLIKELKYDEKDIIFLPNSLATRENILGQYYVLKEKMNIGSEFILYFAGHGIRDMNVPVGQKVESYWLTYKTNFEQIEMEGIRLADVWRLVSKLPAHRKLIILDHCYAGDLVLKSANEPQLRPDENTGSRNVPSGSYSPPLPGKVEPDLSPYQKDIDREIINQTVWTLPEKEQSIAIFAAARDEAYEHSILQHGLLTWAIEKALTSDKEVVDASNVDELPSGTITLQELASYLTITAETEKKRLIEEENLTKLKKRQEFQFELKNTNAAIRGWKLLEIPIIVEISPLLEYLETARQKGLDTTTYTYIKEALEKAKKQVDENGAIAKHNCEGREVYSRLSQAKNSLEELVGGVSRENVERIGKCLRAVMREAIDQCKASQ
jgi:uncharacterized caspase-like protein